MIEDNLRLTLEFETPEARDQFLSHKGRVYTFDHSTLLEFPVRIIDKPELDITNDRISAAEAIIKALIMRLDAVCDAVGTPPTYSVVPNMYSDRYGVYFDE